jgi:hypothetical protein
LRVNGEYHSQQITYRVREMRIGQLIPGPATFRRGGDQTTAAKAGQMIRQVLPSRAQQHGEVSRIRRTIPQSEQQPGPRRIRQCMAEPGQDLSVRDRLHLATVQRPMY